MSWLFSQALVEEYSDHTCLDGIQSAQLNVMPTQHKFWRNDKTIEFSNLSLFGLTLQLLTEDHGKALLMLYLADFHAKTSVLQVKGKDLKDQGLACGQNLPGLFAKWNQHTHSLKTAQCSLLEDSIESSVILPKWGLMQSGELFHVQIPVEFINENAPGLSLPTPGASEGKGSSKNRYRGSPGYRGAKTSEALRTCEEDPIYLNPLFAELIMMWPLGWTDLKPLAMDSFLLWQNAHLTPYHKAVA